MKTLSLIGDVISAICAMSVIALIVFSWLAFANQALFATH